LTIENLTLNARLKLSTSFSHRWHKNPKRPSSREIPNLNLQKNYRALIGASLVLGAFLRQMANAVSNLDDLICANL
jgi:hypothetical protein